ncbi:thiol:disulfide interchange protein DsbC [Pseudomonas duriflava]|uniref:Thiol:disulfide interchange protein n=1 Tax=Pseudomonas duriflava TaxID=459528 RepID=A0A562QPR6_9PSED|nr:bifunctional protein-disulfide isomerase/oxidoreductase DsbC [Pseudomonas duriflava]TWI58748.1 thiol:disulfide interchange protein DsbC [Pseudomonas duriflava]
MRISRFVLAACLGLTSALAVAEPEQAIRKTLSTLQPGLTVEAIEKSPLEGVYQVQLGGGRVLYASEDGQFIMQGYLYQLQNGQAVNLTEQAEGAAIAKQINALDNQQMVVFPAKGETKGHVTVFTDTTCPYCQKLHAEVPELNKQGIEVRYLAFPRQGLGSPGHKQLEAVWCATDRADAMERMFEGKEVKSPSCDDPVAKQFQLGQSMGIQGTPAIILANGHIIPGYQPAKQLVEEALAASQ